MKTQKYYENTEKYTPILEEQYTSRRVYKNITRLKIPQILHEIYWNITLFHDLLIFVGQNPIMVTSIVFWVAAVILTYYWLNDFLKIM